MSQKLFLELLIIKINIKYFSQFLLYLTKFNSLRKSSNGNVLIFTLKE